MDSIILTLTKYILGLIMFIHTAGCLVALQASLQRNNPNSYFNRTDFTSPPGDPPSLMQRGPFVQVCASAQGVTEPAHRIVQVVLVAKDGVKQEVAIITLNK